MASSEVRPETTVRLERSIAAPREAVFAAWTRAEALARWFGPGETYTITVPELEARAGGAYRIEMRHVGGNRHTIVGTYHEVTPPARLVFSWRWLEHADRGDTRVTVELHEDGARTRLVLTHERFPNVEARDAHEQGWCAGLDGLVRQFPG